MQAQAGVSAEHLPWALDLLPEIKRRIGGRNIAWFLDFDGTLAPIVARPDMATLPTETKTLLTSLARQSLVCIMSGRTLEDLLEKVDIPTLYYGADHGRRIVGPVGSSIEHEVGSEARSDLRAAAEQLQHALAHIDGVLVEAKDLSLSVHYRLTPEAQRQIVAETTERMVGKFPGLTLGAGALVHELRPDDGWNKGRAMLWLLESLGLDPSGTCPLCVGDDLTDEDMFKAIGTHGISVLVGHTRRSTHAQYRLPDPVATSRFLQSLTEDGPEPV